MVKKVKCLATTKEGKRCSHYARPYETFCHMHLSKKNLPKGSKSRRLTSAKCTSLRVKNQSPFSKRTLKKDGQRYKSIYSVCEQRMDRVIKRLQKKKDIDAATAKDIEIIKKEWHLTKKVVSPKKALP